MLNAKIKAFSNSKYSNYSFKKRKMSFLMLLMHILEF